MPVERKHTQHIPKLPYGELFFERRLDDYWTTPYKFNAKELDTELRSNRRIPLKINNQMRQTGMYYYGARYYSPEVSIWLSVDPLAEKYPDLSPYAFVANNPIFYVDPDGRDIRISRDDENKTIIIEGNFYFNMSQIDPNSEFGSLEAIVTALNSWANDIQTAVSSMEEFEGYNATVNFSMKEVDIGNASGSDAIAKIQDAANNDPIGNSIVHDPNVRASGGASVVGNKHMSADMRNVRNDPYVFAGFGGWDGSYYTGNTLKHEIGHFFGLRDRPGNSAQRRDHHADYLKQDLMSYDAHRNSAVSPFIRVMHFTGLNNRGSRTVILNRNNREPN